MNMKKFLVAGLLSLSVVLAGCGNQAQNASAQGNAVETQTVTPEQTGSPDAKASEETETKAPEETKVPEKDNKTEAGEQISTLASFIGKTAHDVNVVLGQPSTSKNIENTKTILVNYYKVAFCGETAKVEVVFDPDTQVVNYISFMLLLADDIASTKDLMTNTLTGLYGEPTIERFLDVKGKQGRDWKDDKLVYDLEYYENNISLDIYPQDK